MGEDNRCDSCHRETNEFMVCLMCNSPDQMCGGCMARHRQYFHTPEEIEHYRNAFFKKLESEGLWPPK